MTIAPVESPPRAGEPAPRFGFEASAMARRVCRVWRHAHVPKTHSGEQRQPCNNDFGDEWMMNASPSRISAVPRPFFWWWCGKTHYYWYEK